MVTLKEVMNMIKDVQDLDKIPSYISRKGAS